MSFCSSPRSCPPSGALHCPDDAQMPYPRICAHRGFHAQLPENTLPALGAAVALGADEIEFDLWKTRDNVPVVLHDSTLERVSDGTGSVREKTYKELLQLDFGSKYHSSLAGLKIVTFEELLQHFACLTVMNIHIKSVDGEYFSRSFMTKIAELLYRYGCAGHAYITGRGEVMEAALEIAPDIPRCMGAGPDPETLTVVERAIRYKCSKAQFFTKHFNQELIDLAHQNGIRCNYFYTDDPLRAKELLAMGMDTLLTNNYWQIARMRNEFLQEREKK